MVDKSEEVDDIFYRKNIINIRDITSYGDCSRGVFPYGYTRNLYSMKDGSLWQDAFDKKLQIFYIEKLND